MNVVLQRLVEIHGATLGHLTIGDGLHPPLWTLEEAWRDNQATISCIPPGSYRAVPHGWHGEPVKKPQTWEVVDVPGRQGILMCHVGNDVDDTEGCGLVGLGLMIEKDRAVLLDSAAGLAVMRQLLGAQGFDLQVLPKP